MRWCWLVMVVTACGDGPAAIDAADDAPIDDAAVDAMTDAMTDAPIDAAGLDAPIDAAALDAPIDAAAIDAPIDAVAIDAPIDAPPPPPFTDLAALDPGFATGGVLAIPASTIWEVEVQADHKIVLGGYHLTATYHGFVMRLLPDGSPDPSFGTGGEVAEPGFAPYALTILGDGRIAVAGLGASRLAILDSAGVVVARPALPAPPPSTGFAIDRLIALPDGGFFAVVAAARSTMPGGPTERTPGLIRYDAAANLVTSFGTGGVVMLGITRLGDGRYDATLVRAATGDRLVFDRGQVVFAVSVATGAPDGSFAVTFPPAYWEVGTRVLALPDGRVVTAQRTPTTDYHSATRVQALAAAGSLGPPVTVSYCDVETPEWADAAGLALDPQGRIVVASHTSFAEDVVSLGRIDAAATALDPAWGCGQGFRLPALCAARPCGDETTVNDAAVAADGSTVVIGDRFRIGSPMQGFVARVRP